MNLASVIESHPGEKVALFFEGEEITYEELRRRVGALRGELARAGVGQGAPVALCFSSSPAFVVSYLAVLASGAVAVPLNPLSPPAELARELAVVGAELVLASVSPEGLEGSDTSLVLLEADGRLTKSAESEPPGPAVDLAPAAPAVYLFTSGTAGAPKPAVLTHQNLLSNIEQVEMRVGLAAQPDDVGLLALPAFHILGLNAVLGVILYAGGGLVILERFEPGRLLESCARHRVTLLVGVPQMFAALAGFADAKGDELASLRLACSGGAPLPPEVAAAFADRFKHPIHQGYGLTEAAPTVTFPDLSAPCRPSSVGVPLPGVELRIVDEAGEGVEIGEPGEILVRGPNVFAGYLGDEAATRAALDPGGWLHTGDLGVFSEDGTVTIVDRQKDLVIVSGFNVFPGEVEEVLAAHEAVAEAAVVGVGSEETGEQVVAYAVLTEAARHPESGEPLVSESELIAHCGTHLARYKCPRRVNFVHQLPKGLQGKVLRRAVGE